MMVLLLIAVGIRIINPAWVEILRVKTFALPKLSSHGNR